MVDTPYSCERCDENDAMFFVFERYEGEDGLGAVESEVALCQECIEGVGPEHLENVYANYEFKIDPVPEAFGMTTL